MKNQATRKTAKRKRKIVIIKCLAEIKTVKVRKKYQSKRSFKMIVTVKVMVVVMSLVRVPFYFCFA
jgi:hypothetical protein